MHSALRIICLLVGASYLISAPQSAYTQCYYTDSPECGCFDNSGSWNPGGNILSVASATVGTKESCVSDGGKSFYQIQLGVNSRSDAQSLAYWLDLLADLGMTIYSRSAWCSETIAYWHREAHIPYTDGYKCSWNPSWKLTNTRAIRLWYKTAEDRGARGRWVSGIDLDYEHFSPGVNGPCPGAYQQLEGWNGSEWSGTGDAHSQMVSEMTVYKNASGKVTRVDVTMIEGNASNQIKNTTKYEDIFDYTRYGSKFIGSTRKIRGWGIDLKSDGTPNYDASKIKYIVSKTMMMKAVTRITSDQDQEDASVVAALSAYSKKVEKAAGSDQAHADAALLPSKTRAKQLSFSAGGRAKLDMPLPEPFPLPVKGVFVQLQSTALEDVSLHFADAQKQFLLAKRVNLQQSFGQLRQKLSSKNLPTQAMLTPVYFKFMQPTHVQFLNFTVAGKSAGDVKILGVDLDVDWGPEDSENNP